MICYNQQNQQHFSICFQKEYAHQDGILRSPKGVREEMFLAELDFFKIAHK